MAAVVRWLVEGERASADLANAGPFPTESGSLPEENEEDEWRFMLSLDAFCQQTLGTRLNGSGFRVPQSFGAPLNLPKLYREVCKRGGYTFVTENKLWKPICTEFNLPPTATSCSTQFRLHYERFLLGYEDRFYSSQLMRGAPRKLAGRDSGGGAAEESGGASVGGPSLKRTASDAGVTSGGGEGGVKRAAGASGSGGPRPTPAPAPRPTTPALAAASVPPPPAWLANLTPSQQGAALLSLMHPSVGPYLVVPPHFESENLSRIKLALMSGVRSEVAWALNVLAVASHDPRHELHVTTMPGVLDSLVAIIAKSMERPSPGTVALAVATSLPRRAAPGAPTPSPDAEAAATAAAVDEALRVGVLSSPPAEEAVAAAAAGAAAACILRNLSFTRANLQPLLAQRNVIGVAAHSIVSEAAYASASSEPGAAPTLEDDAAAAERACVVSDLFELLLNLAPHLNLAAAGQPGAPAAAGAAAGTSAGGDAIGHRLLAAVTAALRNEVTPRRCALGAELLSRLATPGNAAAFGPGGVFGDPAQLVPQLVRMLRERERNPANSGMACAALARLAEVPAHCAAIGAQRFTTSLLLAVALSPSEGEVAVRYALQALKLVAEAAAAPDLKLLAAEPELMSIASRGNAAALHAARLLALPMFQSTSVWRVQ